MIQIGSSGADSDKRGFTSPGDMVRPTMNRVQNRSEAGDTRAASPNNSGLLPPPICMKYPNGDMGPWHILIHQLPKMSWPFMIPLGIIATPIGWGIQSERKIKEWMA